FAIMRLSQQNSLLFCVYSNWWIAERNALRPAIQEGQQLLSDRLLTDRSENVLLVLHVESLSALAVCQQSLFQSLASLDFPQPIPLPMHEKDGTAAPFDREWIIRGQILSAPDPRPSIRVEFVGVRTSKTPAHPSDPIQHSGYPAAIPVFFVCFDLTEGEPSV